jgi:thiol:disulfide interchange protein DsbC
MSAAWRLIAVAFILALSAPVRAESDPAEAQIKRILEQRIPGINIQAVSRTPYGGLYEVRSNDDEILYTDEKVNYLFVGSIRDGHNPERNLTEERQMALAAVKFSDLPFQDAFKIVRGNGRRQIAYFSDPNCPYCKKLEQELTHVPDVTINVFLYPILTADSVPKARAIWCSADRSKAWLDWMLSAKPPATAAANCDSKSIDRLLALGRKLRVNSVPTLVFVDGHRLSGARPAVTLAKMIDEADGAAAPAGAATAPAATATP